MTEGQSLRSRVPGQSAMRRIVNGRRGRVTRSRLARFFGANPLNVAERPIYRGALGELLVGDTFDQLGPSWDVLHAVPLDAAEREIDHLVIGPPGVFSVLTRSHSGQDVVVDDDSVHVDGRPDDHLATARFEAESAAARLSNAAGRLVTVQPIIVCVNPRRFAVRRRPQGVIVVQARNLARMLAKLERRLDGPEVALISDVADRGTTWHAGAPAEQDTAELHREFAILRAEVTAASKRRALWLAAAFVLLCALVWGGVALTVAHVVRP